MVAVGDMQPYTQQVTLGVRDEQVSLTNVVSHFLHGRSHLIQTTPLLCQSSCNLQNQMSSQLDQLLRTAML